MAMIREPCQDCVGEGSTACLNPSCDQGHVYLRDEEHWDLTERNGWWDECRQCEGTGIQRCPNCRGRGWYWQQE